MVVSTVPCKMTEVRRIMDEARAAVMNYWRGRIWAPVNAIVYEALKDAGLYKEAKMLAEKSENLLLKEWREHGHVHENYHADTGVGCMKQSEPLYHWGALLGYIAMDADGMV